jgi:hypothetical protein
MSITLQTLVDEAADYVKSNLKRLATRPSTEDSQVIANRLSSALMRQKTSLLRKSE